MKRLLFIAALLCSLPAWAGVSTCAGSFAASTGIVGATQVVNFASCPTFTPKFMIFTVNGQTAGVTQPDTTLNTRHSFGIAASTSSRVYYASSANNGVSTTITNSGWGVDGVVGTISTAGAIECELDSSSIGNGTFTMTVVVQCPTALRVDYFAVGGTDITSVQLASFARGTTAATTQNYTLSFAPDFMLFLGGGSALSSTPPSIAAGAAETIGFWSPSASFWNFASSANAHTASLSTNYSNSNGSIAFASAANSTAANSIGNVTSVAGGNMAIAWSTTAPTSTQPFIVLAVKGGMWGVGSIPISHTAGTVVAATGQFAPLGGMTLTGGNQTLQPSGTATFEQAYGFFDQNLNQVAQCVKDIGASQNPTKERLGISYSDSSYRVELGGQVGIQYHINSFTADGFSGTTLTSSTVQDQLTYYFLVGANPVVAPPCTGQPNTGVNFINGMVYDTGAGAFKIGHGQFNDTGDTNCNVPQNFNISNNKIGYTGQRDTSGIGVVWAGNAHDFTIDHNEIAHTIGGGGIGIGFMLGRAQHARSFTYAHNVTNNYIHDIMLGVNIDMAGVYYGSNLSDFAPTGVNGSNPGAAPTLVPFTYAGRMEGNKIGDVAHDTTTADTSLGAHGLYFDQGASTIYAHNNQFYRNAESCVLNHLSDANADTYSQYNLLDNNVFASCGSSASTVHVAFQRGGDNPNSFTATHNVITWYQAAFPQQNPGHWGCFDNSGNAIACAGRFNFSANTYYRAGAGSAPSFQLCASATNCGKVSGTYTTYTSLATWQAGSGLDAGSTSATNPVLANIAGGDYTPTFVSGNWTPYSWATVGTTVLNKFTLPSNITDMYPINPLLPASYETSGGGVPAVSLSPASLSFGTVNLGAQTGTLPITVSNTGTANLAVSAVTITGTNAGDFSQTNNCGTVAAGSSCVINAIFAPTANGARSATINIADNASGSPHTAAMTGTGQTQTTVDLENLYCTSSDVVTGLTTEGPAGPLQTCMYTLMSHTPSPGGTTHLAAGGNLQNTLNAAACGDIIALDPAGTWTGTFTFPRKGCDSAHWITVRADTADANLPPEGTRITPCYAGVASLPGMPAYPCPNPVRVMPKLVVVATNDSIKVLGDHYRLIGIEVVAQPSNLIVFVGLSMSGGDHIIVDRSWIHGDPLLEFSSAVSMNGVSQGALINSYINDAKCKAPGNCSEGHGIIGGTSSTNDTTIKVVNNLISGSAEDFIFGGGPATATPHDIEVRRNYMFKPLTWNPSDPSFAGILYIVKNHWECKNCDGVLLEGNVMENVWGGFSQVGAAFLFTPKNQAPGSQCPICYDSNFQVRYNWVIRAAQWMQMANAVGSGGFPAAGGGNYSLHDNLGSDLSYKTCYKCSNYQSQLSDLILAPDNFKLKNVLIDHITTVNALDNPNVQGGFLTLGGQVGEPGIVWKNSIIDAGYYGPSPTGQGTGDCASPPVTADPDGPLQKFDSCWAAPYVFQGNVIARGLSVHLGAPQWPLGNFFPTSAATIGFQDLTNGDYHLAATSPYKGVALDGKDPGADIDKVNSYTAGVVNGVPSGGGTVPNPSDNNTSACTTQAYCANAFAGLSTDVGHIGAQTVVIDQPPKHVSNSNFRASLYTGSTTRVVFHLQPWWGCSGLGHISGIGYSEQNPAAIQAIVTAMIAGGANVIAIDYYGTTAPHACELTTVQTVKNYLATNNPKALDGSPFTMMVGIDKGALQPLCTISTPAYSGATTYATGAGVLSAGISYVSLVNSNLNHTPASSPTFWQTMNTCLINALNGQWDFVRDNWAMPGGTIPPWYEAINGINPLMQMFIIRTNWAGTDWAQIYTAVHAHTDTYAHPFKIIDQSDCFGDAGLDGCYAFVRGLGWDVAEQFCWDQPGGCASGFLYLRSFFASCKSHPTLICMGGIWKGFDDSNANWGVPPYRVIAQRCGQTLLDSTAEVGIAGFTSTAQLAYTMVDTWNDYEEGTEIESGVDNCLSLTGSMGGSTLTWVPAFSDATYGTLNTVNFFTIYSQVGNAPMKVVATNIARTATSANLATFIPVSSPTVNYKIFVEAVGKPMFSNQGNWTAPVAWTH